MGDSAIVDDILNFVPTIDWSVSYENEAVSLFETTIRYLGGLLSAFDLLTGPQRGLASNRTNVEQLLIQAQYLARNLSYAFDTPTGIPSNNLYFADRTTDNATTNGLATVGSLVLEWTRLSDLTGDEIYGQLAQRGESYLLNPKPASSEPFPGLVGTNIDLTTGQFVDAAGGWNGGDDSFYEYLIKVRLYDRLHTTRHVLTLPQMYVYDSERFCNYRTR